MGKIAVTRKQCDIFPGDWSVKPEQMYVALSNTTYKDKVNIIEFGAGAGTDCLAQLLTDINVPFKYVSYENDPVYASKRPDVQTVLWSEWPTLLVANTYDLVIIDGPAGRNRIKWYPLVRRHVRKGTVLLIDDYRHFSDFAKAVNINFRHRVIREDTYPPRIEGGQISWLVTRILVPQIRGRK